MSKTLKVILWIVAVFLVGGGIFMGGFAFGRFSTVARFGGFGMMRPGFPGGPGMNGFRHYPSFGILPFVFLCLVALALLAGLVWLVVSLVRRSSSKPVAAVVESTAPQTVKDILQTRFAKGELTREEYEQMLKDVS
jgi:putative membrane protein